MKVIFFGTPDYVIPVMEALYKNYKLVAVVSQPPKLVGRKQIRTFSPVDNWAHKRKIPIITDLAKELPEANFGVVAAYGKILPEKIINHFKYGILNIHPSLLPLLRGASPVQGAIVAGMKETGVSVIKMDAQMDHGPVVSSFKEEIKDDDTTETLTKRLFERSAQFLIDLIPNYLSGKIKLKEQDHSKATFTKILKKQDGYIDLSKEKPQYSDRLIRAMYPWPIAWTFVKIKDKKLRLKLLPKDEVQLEGKNPVSWKEFKQGYPDVELGEI